MFVCETCKCNTKDAVINCQQLQLFKLFDAKEWDTVKPTDLAAMKRIEYVRLILLSFHKIVCDSLTLIDKHAHTRTNFSSMLLMCSILFDLIVFFFFFSPSISCHRRRCYCCCRHYCCARRFDNNGIEVITRFPNLTDVHYLSFRSNKINHIEPLAFLDLNSLEYLDLSDNKLTNNALQREIFEGHFSAHELQPLKNLKWLNLISNELHALNPDVFDHLDNLETLLLGRNQFKIIDPNTASAISSLNKLKVLDLSFMELRTIPEHMLHAPRALHTLNLTGNVFTITPEALYHTPNLVELNLNDNPFKQIGGE